MPGLEYLLPFLLTAVLLAITPGPGMLYIAAQTMGRGAKSGWYSAAGTHLASYVHIFAAAFGLSVFLQAVPAAYLALKLIGAGYLFVLAYRFLFVEEGDAPISEGPQSTPHMRSLRESFVVELTNPKSAIFFLAFLPQFSDPAVSSPLWVQIVVLGVIANMIFSVVEICCVIFADRVASLAKSSKSAGRWMRRFAASIMVALGAKLLLSER